MSLEDTLKERGAKYGLFINHANYTQEIKDIFCQSPNWDVMDADQREALDMIAHKIGRILSGDPHYDDSWIDIAGYATLVAKRLKGDVV